MDKFDLIILGGGPAGYNAAERAGHAGLSVLLIEKRALGGVCLNEGCIPSKALLNSAKIYDYAKSGEKYGVAFSGAALDHKAVITRKNKVVKTLVSGVGAKMKQNKVTVISADAVVRGRTANGFEVDAGGTLYTGDKLLVATGSVPMLPPIPGLKEALESGFAMTNREVLDLEAVPKSMVVIGGGVIGIEMASYYGSAGCKVTVIEMLDHIGGPIDLEIAGILLKNYQKKGVEFKLGCKVTGFGANTVSYEEGGKTASVSADKVLVSIGRRPFTEGLGLESIGLETERGAVRTDEFMKTSVAGVFAAGDVNGVSMLAHTAYREGEVAVNNMLGKRDRMMYNSIPGVIYTNPEVATVGETEQSAREKGFDAGAVTLSMRYSGRYLAENEGGDGICKIVYDKAQNRILGVHMIGGYASEIIYGAGMMIDAEMDIDRIKKFVFPHPTVCEIIRESVFEI